MDRPVHVIGASGRSGLALCRSLLANGAAVVPVVRDAGRWRAGGIGIAPVVADLADSAALARALGDAGRVVSCAHAHYTAAILAAAPATARLVLLGSTRRYSRWPDTHGNGVLAGESALLASGRPGVMLHPTMIYGTQGENNVQRLAALLWRLPVVPLPRGGRSLVQPIHQDDVTRCLRAALALPWDDGPRAMVIAGPAPLPYAAFVRAVAKAAGLPPPWIVPVPAWALRLASPLTGRVGLPQIRQDEIRRLLEDKGFSIAEMIANLGVRPVALDEGLARTFRR